MATKSKTLANLGLTTARASQLEIQGLAVDSRDVRDGFLFAALPGSRSHGAEFAPYALRQGASAILTDPDGAAWISKTCPDHAAQICVVDDPRQALAAASALFFGAQPEVMVAVTGTNGKTSVASFCRQIWSELGLSAINLGTTGVQGAWSAPLSHTTPEPITLHRVLAQAAAAGVTHGAMEASSHGLEQKRLDGVVLAVAGFTNFTQDHLDYHATFEAYFAAKSGLFDRVLGPQGWAVINIDDAKGMVLYDACRKRGQSCLTVGRSIADLQILGQTFDANGQDSMCLAGHTVSGQSAFGGWISRGKLAVGCGHGSGCGRGGGSGLFCVEIRETGARAHGIGRHARQWSLRLCGLCPYARCCLNGAASLAAACEGAACCGFWRRRRPRSGQAGVDGASGGGACGQGDRHG